MLRIALFLTFISIVHSVQAADPEILHCSDFGCKTKTPLTFSPQQWQRLNAIFARPALSAWLEKQQIRQAIALMEQYSGEVSGTHHDRGGNYPGADLPHQMDCIDESTNTFQYLVALEELQLLKHHRVDQKYRRIIFIFSHWTAAITEIGSERKFAVDSWYRDNGELPYIQSLEDWMHRRDWPAAFNPELAVRYAKP